MNQASSSGRQTSQKQSTKPLLTILTRAYARPAGLHRCKMSLEIQTDQDFEQIIIEDKIGQGLPWANQQIALAADKINGDWVYILDDDDFLICETFVADFKAYLKDNSVSPYEIVLVKGWILEREMPTMWETIKLDRKQIGSPNFIVSKQLFEAHCSYWNVNRAGDYNFIRRASMNCSGLKWWDKFVFFADPSGGKTEDIKNKLRRNFDV